MDTDKKAAIKQWLRQYKIPIICVIAVLAVALGINGCQRWKDQHSGVNIQQTQGSETVTPQNVKAAIPNSTPADQRDISKLIEHRQQYKPDYSFYSTDKAAGDQAATVFAKEHNSKNVIKQTSRTDVPAADDSKPATIYNNNYYAIQQNRKHDIKVGAVVIHDKAAAEVSYRNRDIEYKVFIDQQGAAGGGVSYTVAKW